jgi:prepilin-type processing-associated H-X9-DG protein
MRQRYRGFTLIEILIVIGLLMLLMGLFAPALVRAQEQARRLKCLNNMRQIGLAVHVYAQYFDGYFPPSSCQAHGEVEEASWWLESLQPYGGGSLVYRCPSDRAGNFVDWENPPPPAERASMRWCSYKTNGRMDLPPYNRISAIPRPCDTVYVCESPESAVGADHVHPRRWMSFEEVKADVAFDRHGATSNFLFADGHVEAMALEETWEVNRCNRWNPKRAPAWCTPMPGDWK